MTYSQLIRGDVFTFVQYPDAGVCMVLTDCNYTALYGKLRGIVAEAAHPTQPVYLMDSFNGK